MPLVENDLKHLTAANGYVELGMFVDANAELEESVKTDTTTATTGYELIA